MDDKLKAITDHSTAVLIVDDSIQYCQVLTRILQNGLGFMNVTSVENTQSALDLIEKEPERFGLLFVDYHFPDGTSGGKLLDQLKTLDLLGNKVAFLITSEPTADNLKEAVAAGALGVVAKPFDRGELQRQLEKAHRSITMKNTEGF